MTAVNKTRRAFFALLAMFLLQTECLSCYFCVFINNYKVKVFYFSSSVTLFICLNIECSVAFFFDCKINLEEVIRQVIICFSVVFIITCRCHTGNKCNYFYTVESFSVFFKNSGNDTAIFFYKEGDFIRRIFGIEVTGLYNVEVFKTVVAKFYI